MNTTSRFKILGIGLLLNLSEIAAVNAPDYNFSPERSIWGKGPVHAIQPENKEVVRDSGYISPFEEFDLSNLETEKNITKDIQRLKFELKKSRVIRTTAPLMANDSHTHLGISFMGGTSSLTFNSEFGESKGSFSPGIMLDYLYFFHQKWGAHIGIGLQWSNSKFESNKTFKDENSYVDYEGDQLNMSYSIKDIDEKFKTMFLSIPLMGCYNWNDFIFSAGLKVAFPIHIKYEQTLNDVEISGEYPFSDKIVPAKAIGADHWDQMKSNGKFSKNPVYIMLTGEIGYKYKLNNQFDLGASIYGDYALNDLKMRAKNDEDNTQYETGLDVYDLIKVQELNKAEDVPAKRYNASTLCSKQMSTGKRVIDKCGYYNVGLKITLYFSSYGNDTKEANKEIEKEAEMMQ